MKKLMIALWDQAAEIWSDPEFALSRGDAMRRFELRVKTEGNVVHDHPEQFDLFELGEFDVRDGKTVLFNSRRHLANGLQVVGQEDNPPRGDV